MKKSQAVKYIEERLCYGGDCTAKTQTFIFAPAAITAMKLFTKEQLQKAINSINKKATINGVKGLCSKADVIKAIKAVMEEPFPDIQLYPKPKP